MIKKLILLFIAFGFSLSAQSNFNYGADFKKILEKSKSASDPLSYDKLLPRYNQNDSTLSDAEMLALLIGFTAKPEYNPYHDISQEQAIYNLNAEGKYDTALVKAVAFLKTHPFSIKVLYEVSFAYYKARKTDSAKFYVDQGKRIFKAMKYSGDGKSKQMPMFALSHVDGQEYIYKHISGGIGERSMQKDADGNLLEILEVKLRAGAPYFLHFSIQHAVNTDIIDLQPGEPIEREILEKKQSNK